MGDMNMPARFLLLSDIHGNREALLSILNTENNYDIVIIAGDITGFGNREEASEMLSIIREHASGRPYFFVAGNCDTLQARECFAEDPGYLESVCSRVHLTRSEKEEPCLAGSGGGLLHTGMTCFERTEEELARGLRSGLEHAGTRTVDIIVTHTPPHGTMADLRHGRHLGSREFLALLYEVQPALWVCGHIHESASAVYEERTLVVNPGPAVQGKYAIAVAGQSDHAGFLHFHAELRSI